jgi:hypothetical protein
MYSISYVVGPSRQRASVSKQTYFRHEPRAADFLASPIMSNEPPKPLGLARKTVRQRMASLPPAVTGLAQSEFDGR